MPHTLSLLDHRITTLFGEEEETIPDRVTTPAHTATPAEEVPPALQPGWAAAKQYYAIGEVAALFGVRTSHIRFWTKEFGLPVRTTRGGDRLYTPTLIHAIRTIYHLTKERGLTLAGAKARMAEGSKRGGSRARKKPAEEHAPAPTGTKLERMPSAAGIGAAEAVALRSRLLRLRNLLVTMRNELG